MINPYKIKWASLSSLDLDLLTELSFDGDSGQTSTFLNRENITTEHYDGRRIIHRSKYQEILAPTITLIKQNYGDFNPDENRKILSWLTSSEKPGYLEIFHDDSEVVSYRLFGNWTEIEQYKLGNGRVVGYVATFESSSPYAWSRKIVYPEVYETADEINNNDENNDYLAVSGTKEITLVCNSDEYKKPIYPKVTITFNDSEPEDIYFPVTTDPMATNYKMMPNVLYSYNDLLYVNINKGDINDQGKFVITENLSIDTVADSSKVGKHYYFPGDKAVKKIINTSNDEGAPSYVWKTVSLIGAAVKIDSPYTLNGETVVKEITVSGGAQGEKIILDGTNKVVYSDTNQLKIIGDDFNWEWLAFVAGTNTFSVTGNCKIKFEWLEPRKVGSL